MIRDFPFIVEEKGLIEINYGRRFPFRKSYLLYVFLLVVFVVPLFTPFSLLTISFQFISVLLMLFIFTANTGINIENKERVKFFMCALGFQIGTWKKFSKFSCLVLKSTMKKRENTIANELGDGVSVTERFKTTEIYMMDSFHRKKIMCGSFDSYKKAKEFAKEVSLIVGYPIEKFSPKRIQRRR
jgi:hypothetical protein